MIGFITGMCNEALQPSQRTFGFRFGTRHNGWKWISACPGLGTRRCRSIALGIFSSPICMILIGLILYSIIRSQYQKGKLQLSRLTKKRNLSEEARITAASWPLSSSSTRRGGGQAPRRPDFRSHFISLRFPLRFPSGVNLATKLVTTSRASFIRPFEGLTLSALYPLKINAKQAYACLLHNDITHNDDGAGQLAKNPYWDKRFHDQSDRTPTAFAVQRENPHSVGSWRNNVPIRLIPILRDKYHCWITGNRFF